VPCASFHRANCRGLTGGYRPVSDLANGWDDIMTSAKLTQPNLLFPVITINCKIPDDDADDECDDQDCGNDDNGRGVPSYPPEASGLKVN
jgi:hypothetical protein